MKDVRTRTIWGLVFFLYFSLITIPNAHAYIDPGTGSYIFQVTIGAILGGLVAIGAFWRRIWAFVSGKSRREKHEAQSASTSAVGADAPPAAHSEALESRPEPEASKEPRSEAPA